MFKSSLLFISICLVLCVCESAAPINGEQGQSLPARQRDGRQPVADEGATAAAQEISTQLNSLLSGINQGKDPDAANLTQIADTLKKNTPYLQKMDAKGQSNLQLLNAWMNYFSGEIKRAKLAASAAYKGDPKNKDAEITFIVMSIANNDIKNAKNTIGTMRKNATRAASASTRRDRQNAPASDSGTPAVLDFDVNSVKVELLDKNIGAFDAACLNGASFSFKGGKTLMMLLWAEASAGANASSDNSTPQMMMPGMESQSGQTLSPAQTYASLFANMFQDDKVAFLGLNLDAADKSGDVMATLMKNTWPWPQVMAQDPRNTSLAFFASLRADKPSLVIVGPDGAIKYAGSLSGLMLRVMANQARLAPETQLAIPETSKKIEEANALPVQTADAAVKQQPKDANIPAAVSAPRQQPMEAAAPQPKKAPKSDEERLNPAATDLYQFAVSQKRMAHVTGYGTMVNSCRQILKEYPDAPEAEKARQLLREIPESKRQQYHITNEEMGL